MVFDFEHEGLIQGGMNSAGLFFDGTATPFVPMDFSDKEEFKGKDMWLTLLQTCRTANDAVVFISKYKVPDLEKVHLFFADKSGQSVIVGAYDGKLTFTWKTQPQQVLTNFNITDPEYGGEQPCPRFATAIQILTHPDDAFETAKRVLQQTTQGELTVYSSLFDLTEGTVTVFYQGDFTKSVTVNLAGELKRGAHAMLISKSVH
jgi:penicillin V acylase-like amidase (Ntn superfamily)